MVDIYGVLGQQAPAAGALVDVYTVPAGKVAHIRIAVANRSAVPDSFRVALSVAGAPIASSHYVAFDMPIAENDSVLSGPLVVKSTDVVRVYSGLGDLTFTVTGLEEDG